VGERPSFAAMLNRIAGHDFLKSLGVSLIPATAPDFFTEDTPTAVLVRQVLGAVAQFEKASTVAKLKAAREGEALGRMLVEKALAGDPAALRICMKRL
jgi:hypothetical protein